MNLTRKAYVLPIIVVILASLACNISTGGNNNNANTDSSPDSSSPQAGKIDLGKFTGDINLSLVRTDKKSFSNEEFLAHNIPVEVNFSGDETADVIFKGAITESATYASKSGTISWDVDIFVTLQKSSPTIIDKVDNKISLHLYTLKFKVDLLDKDGSLIPIQQNQAGDVLWPNYPQIFDLEYQNIPETTASAKVTFSIQKYSYGASPNSKLTDTDLNFQMPNFLTLHTPVQYSLQLNDFTDAQKGVVAEYHVVYKNPLNADLTYRTTLLFLDGTGALVGYAQTWIDTTANGTNDNESLGWQSFYLAGIPTQVLIYDKWDNFEAFVIASR